jgi:hypothetical protein
VLEEALLAPVIGGPAGACTRSELVSLSGWLGMGEERGGNPKHTLQLVYAG